VLVDVQERIPGLPAQALPAASGARFIPMTGTTIAADKLLFR
jgi:hypothetical protein